jgi:hypothetical protein
MRHSFRPRPQKPPKQPKPKRPQVKELRQIYRGLVTQDEGQRVASLAYAMQWYDNALPYVVLKAGGQLSTEQAKDLDVAAKCRARGISTTSANEKEVSFRMALRRYEKVSSLLKPPSVEVFLKQLDEQSGALAQRQQQMVAKWGKVTDTLQLILKPETIAGQPLTLRLGHIEEPYRVDPERLYLSMRRDYVKQLRKKIYREGILPTVLEVLEPLSRLGAMEPEVDAVTGQRTGRYTLSLRNQLQLQQKLMQNFIAWAKSEGAPKRLVRHYVAPDRAATAGANTTTVPRASSANKVAGVFHEGSPQAILYTALLSGEWKTKPELKKMIPPQYTLAVRLDKVNETGVRLGQWWLEIEANKVRMHMGRASSAAAS